FAMYVNGKRILGEVLERHRARQVFEYIRRQQRDPALLEWVGGNLFKMRVFPIEPHSEKRIQLGYTQVLRRDRGFVTYSYPLVSEKLVKNPLRRLGIEFRVTSGQGLAGLSCRSHAAEPLVDGNRGALGFTALDYTPERDFTVAYRVDDSVECLAFANARPDEDDGYFLLELAPKLDLAPRAPSNRMIVVVDGSASMGPKGYALATEFASAAADFSLGWDLGVIVAGAAPEQWREEPVAVDAGTPAEVGEFLSGHILLGGTDLYETFRAAAKAIESGKAGEQVELVYVGDGIDTLGEREGPALVRDIASLFRNRKVRGSCVAVGSAYDEPLLTKLAASLGGAYVRVDDATDVFFAADDMLERVSRPALSNVRLSFEGVDVAETLPPRISALPAGSSAVVVGRLKKGGDGRVVLRGSAEGEKFERSYPVVLEADTERNRFVPRLWARAKIDDIMADLGLMASADDARIRQDVIATSVKYQIMSPFTAFLVLESEEDYRRYGIKRRLKMWDWKGDEGGIEFSGRASGRKALPAPAFVGTPPMSRPAIAAAQKRAELSSAAREYAPSGLVHAGEKVEEFWAIDHMETEVGGDWGGWIADTARGEEEAISAIPMADEMGQVRRRFEHSLFGPKSPRVDSRGGASYGFGNGGGRRGSSQSRSLVLTSGEVAGLKIDSPPRPSWEYRRLVVAGKATDETRLGLALALESEGRFAKALEALGAVIEKHARVPELRLEQGVLAARVGDYEAMREAFAKAVEVADDAKRSEVEQRVPPLLANLQRNREAAEAYEKLAREAKDAKSAAALSSSAAYYHVRNRKRELARKVWEGTLVRFPDEAAVWAQAGQWHLNQAKDPARAVEMLRRARELGAKGTPWLLQALFRLGERKQAIELVNELVRSAKQQNEISNVLHNLGNYDRPAATAEAVRLLKSGSAPHLLAGAVLYLQGYGRGSTDVAKAVLEAVGREDFPASVRQQTFYFLWNSGRHGKEVLRVLEPLIEDTSTPEAIARAVSAASALVQRAPEEGIRHFDRLLGL
ncbi:MAG: VIT domain-containing protein, partial [Planctomycetota bacterium]